MKYKVIFEHIDFLIISKMDGIEFHTPEGIVQVLQNDFSRIIGVHRLDKMTSGLMVFARNENTAKYFNELFASKKISKYYLAISASKPKKKQGMIKGDLEKSRNGSYRLSRNMTNPSQTKFYSFPLDGDFRNLNLRGFILKPFTGKTHQLRVVLKSLGSPILGDDRYKGIASDRLYLHAFRLEFDYQNQHFSFEDYPISGDYFLAVEKQFRDEFSHHLNHLFEASY